MMPRCYGRENWEAQFGEPPRYSYCASAVNINGVDYCTLNEKTYGYVLNCGNRKLDVLEQPTLFDYMREGEQ